VTYAKIQNVTNNRLLGNFSGGAAAPAEIAISSNLQVASSTLDTVAPQCRAKGSFNSSGTLVSGTAYNVSSVTHVGTAQYRVNFTSALTNYLAVAIMLTSGGPNT